MESEPTTPPVTNITYVSVLTHLEGDRIPPAQRLVWLKELFASKLPLILFVDEYYHDILEQSTQIVSAPHVTLIPFYPELSQTYKEVAAAAAAHGPLRLPEHRNAEKDTEAFCRLMNLKPELVARAVAGGHVRTPFVGFLDASISKILPRPEEIWAELRQFQIREGFRQVLLPGCWKPAAVRKEDVIGRILWTFCGGAFWLPTEAAEEWWEICRKGLGEILAEGRITWEVNVWAWMWQKRPDVFFWFPADHNERMLRPPAEVAVTTVQN